LNEASEGQQATVDKVSSIRIFSVDPKNCIPSASQLQQERPRGPRKPNLADLPEEILEAVISSLGSDVAARANLMQSCKRLCRISKKRSVWDSAKKAVKGIALRAQIFIGWRASGWGVSSQTDFSSGRHRLLFGSALAKEIGLFDYFGPDDYASLALLAAASGAFDTVRVYCGKLFRSRPLEARAPEFLEQLARLAVGSRSPETLAAAQGPWGVDVSLLKSINSPTGVLFRLAARSGSVAMILALEGLGLDMRATPPTFKLVMEEAAMHGHVAVLDFMVSLAELCIRPAQVFEWVVTPTIWHTSPVEASLVWARKFLVAANVHPRLPFSAFRDFELHPAARVLRYNSTGVLQELIAGNWLGRTQADVLEALRSNFNGALRESVISKNVKALRLLRSCGLTPDDARAQQNHALCSALWYPSAETTAILRELREQWGLGPADLHALRRYISIDVYQADAQLLQELREHWDGPRILGIGPRQQSGRDDVPLVSSACLLCPNCLTANWTQCLRPRTPILGMHSLDGTNHAYVLAYIVKLAKPAAVTELRRHWGFGPEHVRTRDSSVIATVVKAGRAAMLGTLRQEFGLSADDATGMVAAASERGHLQVLRELRQGFGLGADGAAIRSVWKGEAQHEGVQGTGVRVLRELALFGLSGGDARANDNELLGKAIAHAQADVVVALARAPWGLGAADFCQVIPALGQMQALISPCREDQARGVAVVRALRLLYGMGGLGSADVMRVVVPHFASLLRSRPGLFARQLVDELVALPDVDATALALGLGIS